MLDWWEAYDIVEPFGEQRADLRVAHVAAVILRRLGLDEEITPGDLMPTFGGPNDGGPEINQVETVEQQPDDVDREAERAELAALAAIERRRQLVDAHNAKVSR